MIRYIKIYKAPPPTKTKYSIYLIMVRFGLLSAIVMATTSSVNAFTNPLPSFVTSAAATTSSNTQIFMADEFVPETPETTKARIQTLVDENPVLLFMKGSKIFPQCGFSNTAVQILDSYQIDFHTVDVLADEAIRQGVKDFSAWPTIPQLYVAGEFIGGSDIMIEMYQSGELGEMIEKAKADMV